MNILDVLIMILVGLFVLHSFFRGLVKEVFALSALIVGILTANNFYPAGAVFLVKWGWASHPSAQIMSYLLIFAIFSVGIVLIGRLVHKLLGKLNLGWLNRLGGCFFGLFKGLLIISVLVLFLTMLLPAKNPLLTKSIFTPHLLSVIKTVSILIPDNYKELDKKKKEVLRKWKDSLLIIINDIPVPKKEEKAKEETRIDAGIKKQKEQ